MTYFHLMSDDMPPERLEGHPPYVRPDEAIRAAETEARGRGKNVQIFRVQEGEAESQPWRVVEPPEQRRDA